MRRKHPLAAKKAPVRNTPQTVMDERKQTWKACTPSEGKERLWARSWLRVFGGRSGVAGSDERGRASLGPRVRSSLLIGETSRSGRGWRRSSERQWWSCWRSFGRALHGPFTT
jgi:hypothetical protein